MAHYSQMPFGKHYGLPMEDVPTSYLLWCINVEAGRQYPGFLECVKTLLRARGITFPEQQSWNFNDFDEDEEEEEPERPPPASPRAAGVSKLRVAEVIAAGRRALAARYHPDVNRSPDAVRAMQEANAAADWLEACKDTLR